MYGNVPPVTSDVDVIVIIIICCYWVIYSQYRYTMAQYDSILHMAQQ